MRKSTANRKAMSFPFFLLIPFLVVCSCQGNPITSGSKSSDLQLSFKVLGVSSSPASLSKISKAVSKLILASASTLTVSLTPADSSLPTPAAQTIAISGSGALTLSVTFSGVEYGTYTVKAVASDSNGTAQFQQTGTVTVSASTPAVTLNLVPANPKVMPNQTNVPITELAPGAAYMMEIPASCLNENGEYFLYYSHYSGEADYFGASGIRV